MANKYKNVFPNTNLSDMNEILWANNMYSRADIDENFYKSFYRFGPPNDPYNSITGAREYLFFTKPDLHITDPHSKRLNPELANQMYFQELMNRYPEVISQLQLHNKIDTSSPFMILLSNTVNNTLDLPSISSSVIDNPQTIYGTSYNYRGWGYTSDEKIDFSLEFKDTKYLEVYNLIKAYEEYERLKHLGIVTPPNIDLADEVNGKAFSYYIRNKVLHDQFSIYKFIVEDDGETIIYYAKLWGVFIKSVPRDAFSDLKAENGITYSVDFEAAFVDDMNPAILKDFNNLVLDYAKGTQYLPIYNKEKRMIDGRLPKLPFVTKIERFRDLTWVDPSSMQYKYKLTWRV